ncbi:MAG TPA: glucan biosynthesis protein [Chthoniobacterales bacterium]|jgi:glucans biosynthesis protein
MKSAFSSGTSGGWWRSSGILALAVFLLGATPAGAADMNDAVFDQVVRQAQQAAAASYQPNEMVLPQVLQSLDYDTYRMITFRRETGLWFGEKSRFQVQLFHPGYIYKEPVAINEVVDGQVHPVDFGPKFFRYPRFDPALLRESKLGFAGFRLLYPLEHREPVDEVISFIGASYFRALALGQVYGISARGLAIDTAENIPEEFPVFREFWLCRPAPKARAMEFFARLESASVSGAYRFQIKPGTETIVEVEMHLFFRKSVQVFGLAPLTSMFWRDESNPRPPDDTRPEVHDSDTLSIETAAGKVESHPLEQRDHVTTLLFPEKSPRGFGLLQRDRDPAHYHDSEAQYSRRPSVFVEAIKDWGKGTVRLMQLPTRNEYFDNVVAFWQPEKKPVAGDELQFRYRLRWFNRESNKDRNGAVRRNSSDEPDNFRRGRTQLERGARAREDLSLRTAGRDGTG